MLKVIIIGNLGRDPEMRYTPNGEPITNFPVATTERWTDKSGERVEKTIWVKVSAFGKQAEITNQYLAKGKKVYIEGSLNSDDKGNPKVFERKDGTFGASYEVRLKSFEFLSPRGDSDEGGSDEWGQSGSGARSGDEEPLAF